MKKIIIISAILIVVLGIIGFIVYGNVTKPKENIDNSIGKTIDELYQTENSINSIEEDLLTKQEIEDVERKKAYYDENGFVTESLYIDCQIYCEFDNDNIKAAVDTRIEDIKNKILEEPPNTSGMVVINLSANTKLHEKINVLEYNETYRRYKMLKTYFDDTFYKQIMAEANKPENSNIFNVDLENNKNISYTNDEETIYYSVKTGQRIQNVADLFSSEYDYAKVIKDRVKYMLDLNVGYSENEVNKKVNDAYNKLKIDIDLLNEKLKISLDEDGFEMFFDEFDISQMTIY